MDNTIIATDTRQTKPKSCSKTVAKMAVPALLVLVNQSEPVFISLMETIPIYGLAPAIVLTSCIVPLIAVMETIPIWRETNEMVDNAETQVPALLNYVKKNPLTSTFLLSADAFDSVAGVVDAMVAVSKFTNNSAVIYSVGGVMAVGLIVNYIPSYAVPSAQAITQMCDGQCSRQSLEVLQDEQALANLETGLLVVPRTEDGEVDTIEISRSVKALSISVTLVSDFALTLLGLQKISSFGWVRSLLGEDALLKCAPLAVLPMSKTLGSMQLEFRKNMSSFLNSPRDTFNAVCRTLGNGRENGFNLVLCLMGAISEAIIKYAFVESFLQEIGLRDKYESDFSKAIAIMLQTMILSCVALNYTFSVAPRFFKREHTMREKIQEALSHVRLPELRFWTYQRHKSHPDGTAVTPSLTRNHQYADPKTAHRVPGLAEAINVEQYSSRRFSESDLPALITKKMAKN